MMDFQGLNILLLEGYGRQILPYLRAFKALGCKTTVICNAKVDVGYVSRFADHKILGVCDTERYEESERCVCDIIKNGNYDVVVPMGDFAATILANNKEELSKYAKIAVNDKERFLQALNKQQVMQVCMENGIPCPKTLPRVSKVEQLDLSQLVFPLVVKPEADCGARGFHCFKTMEELLAFAEGQDLSGMVLQEYIPQSDRNMSCGLFIDPDGTVKSAYTYISRRWYPIKGGTGTFNQLIDRPDMVEMCEKLAKLMGLTGTLGFDFVDDLRDGTPKLLEINPRVLACAKIGFEAGLDQARQLLEMAYGEPVTAMETSGKPVNIRMSQIDVLWFLKSPDRFRAQPSWFSCKNTKDQTFSWDDPLPWFAFLLRGLGRFGKETKARE
ncbi:MAG: ATP-grasp domain-containing protein [Oscillospiraceae bacterium]|nr:ATP-grasp domain-containing protein [Oscillospiraceae bacterium]